MTAPDRLIRPALQLALAVARAGAAAEPRVPPPRLLQPVLGHRRITDAALDAIRRALDTDEAFRERVAVAVDENEHGRPAYLFLARPEGWEGELEALAAAEQATAEDAEAEREEHSARRRLRVVEDACRRAEEQLQCTREEAGSLAAELSAERQARRAAEDAVQALERRVSALEKERDSAHRRAAEADGLRRRVAELEQALQRTSADLAAEQAAVDVLRHELEGEGMNAEEAAPPATFDRQVVARAVADAAAAAARLGDALARAAAELGEHVREDVPAAPAPALAAAAVAPRPTPLRRRPVALPPAVHDDGGEAAEHLVRVPKVLILVDGYNASLSYRPELPLAEQRRRLQDALHELAARTGAEVHVVFDGAEEDGRTVLRPEGRRGVRATFTPAGTEADDAILALLDGCPPERPVVVASSDRRVQQGARRRGANVLSSDQLLDVLKRGR